MDTAKNQADAERPGRRADIALRSKPGSGLVGRGGFAGVECELASPSNSRPRSDSDLWGAGGVDGGRSACATGLGIAGAWLASGRGLVSLGIARTPGPFAGRGCGARGWHCEAPKAQGAEPGGGPEAGLGRISGYRGSGQVPPTPSKGVQAPIKGCLACYVELGSRIGGQSPFHGFLFYGDML